MKTHKNGIMKKIAIIFVAAFMLFTAIPVGAFPIIKIQSPQNTLSESCNIRDIITLVSQQIGCEEIFNSQTLREFLMKKFDIPTTESPDCDNETEAEPETDSDSESEYIEETTSSLPEDSTTSSDHETTVPDEITDPNDVNNTTPDSNVDASMADFEQEVLDLINQIRAENGLSTLTSDPSLQEAAGIRAIEIGSVFSHTRPNGESCFTVLDECNISYRTAGENIALGQRTPEQVVNDWMNSEGHRANILNGNFTKLGIGFYINETGRYCWSQMFIG